MPAELSTWLRAIDEFALQWALQSLLLSAGALTLARLLREKGPVVESVVLRFALAALWICPVATVAISHLHVDGVPISIPPPAPALQPAQTEALPTPLRVAPANDMARATGPSGYIHDGPRQIDTAFDLRTVVYALLPLAWLSGSIYLLAALLASYALLLWVRRQAVPVPDALDALLAAQADAMRAPKPRIAAHDTVRGPCVTGFVRPLILLPSILANNADEMMRSILLHELAHVKRRDCLWNLFAYITACALWFQPLVWRLRRRLDETSDLIADDYVIQHRQERAAYARHLVALAESFEQTRRVPLASAGIAPPKSEAGKRVHRILDSTRRITLGPARSIIALAGVLALLATLAAGVIGAASSEGRPIDPIQGTVYSSTGKPLAGAVVEFGESVVSGDDIINVEWRPIAKTIAASDGSFSFGNLRATQRNSSGGLRISAPGFVTGKAGMMFDSVHPQRFHSSFYRRSSATADIVLWRTGKISGTVTDRKGGPIVGATVECVGSESSVTSDAQGRFTLQDIPDYSSEAQYGRRTMLDVSHPDFVSVTVDAAAGAQDVKIAMDTGVLIQGTVRDRETGKGLPDFWVVATRNGYPITKTDADKDGKYRLRFAAGQVTLNAARKPKRDPLANNYVRLKADQTIFVAEGETQTGADIVVTKGRVVRGRVIDVRTKQPVEGLSVDVILEGARDQAGFFWNIRSGLTDADGQFVVSAIAPGSYSIEGTMPDETMKTQKFTLDVGYGDDPKPVELTAVRRLTNKGLPESEPLVTGMVVFPDGRPAPMATVTAYVDVSRNERGMVRGRCAPDGTFGLNFARDLLSGPGEFRAYDSEKKFTGVVEVNEVVAPPQPLVIKLRQGATFSGTVRTTDGQPVQGVSVVVSRMVPSGAGFSQNVLCQGVTGGDGRYTTSPYVPSSRDAAASLECQAMHDEQTRRFMWPRKPEGRYSNLNVSQGAHAEGLDFTLVFEGREAYYVAKPAQEK